jgi:hypothetical protein
MWVSVTAAIAFVAARAMTAASTARKAGVTLRTGFMQRL